MKNQKVLFLVFFVFWIKFSTFGQESNAEQIKQNSLEIKKYSDSLQYYIQLLNLNKIDDISYQLSINRVSSELSKLSGSNFEITYHIADSVYYAQYVLPEPIQEDPIPTANPSEMATPMDGLDTANFDFKPKRNLTATALQMVLPDPTRRTRMEFSIKFGFNGSTINNNTNSYPQFNIGQNFYFQYLGFGFKTRLGNEHSRFSIRYGIGLDYLSLKQKDNIRILRNVDDKPIFIDPKTEGITNLDEYKIRLKYLKIPIGIQAKISKKVKLHVNTFYNILVRERTYSRYSLDSKHDETITSEKDFKLNKNIFGMEYAISYKRINLFFEHSLNSILNNNSTDELKYYKFGIGIR